MAAVRGRTLTSFGMFAVPFYVDGTSAEEDEGGTGGGPGAPAVAATTATVEIATPLAPIATGPHLTMSVVDVDPIFMSRPEGAPLRELRAIESALEKRLRE